MKLPNISKVLLILLYLTLLKADINQAHQEALTAYKKNGNAAEAVAILEKGGIKNILKSKPADLKKQNYTPVLNDYGFFQHKQGNFWEAREALELSIALDTTRTIAYLNLGDVYSDQMPDASYSFNKMIGAYRTYNNKVNSAKVKTSVPVRVFDALFRDKIVTFLFELFKNGKDNLLDTEYNPEVKVTDLGELLDSTSAESLAKSKREVFLKYNHDKSITDFQEWRQTVNKQSSPVIGLEQITVDKIPYWTYLKNNIGLYDLCFRISKIDFDNDGRLDFKISTSVGSASIEYDFLFINNSGNDYSPFFTNCQEGGGLNLKFFMHDNKTYMLNYDIMSEKDNSTYCHYTLYKLYDRKYYPAARFKISNGNYIGRLSNDDASIKPILKNLQLRMKNLRFDKYWDTEWLEEKPISVENCLQVGINLDTTNTWHHYRAFITDFDNDNDDDVLVESRNKFGYYPRFFTNNNGRYTETYFKDMNNHNLIYDARNLSSQEEPGNNKLCIDYDTDFVFAKSGKTNYWLKCSKSADYSVDEKLIFEIIKLQNKSFTKCGVIEMVPERIVQVFQEP